MRTEKGAFCSSAPALSEKQKVPSCGQGLSTARGILLEPIPT